MDSEKGFSILIIFFVIALIAAFSGIVALQARNTTPVPTPVSNTRVEEEFPPLWGDVEWGEVEKMEIVFIGSSGETIQKQGYYIHTSPITIATANNFRDFYEKKLLSLGWKEVDYASGTEGEFLSYYKDGKHFSFGYKRISDTQFRGFLEYD